MAIRSDRSRRAKSWMLFTCVHNLLEVRKDIIAQLMLVQISNLSSPPIRQRRDGNVANTIVFPSQSNVPIAHQ